MKKEQRAGSDTRLTKEQKQTFERAARLGGYRTLSDFIVSTAQEKAREIIREKEEVIASRKDQEIFFEAITNPGEPNEELRSAVKAFEEFVSR